MYEVENGLDQLILRLRTTKEYNQYRTLLERVKQQPELYNRIGQFRRRGMWIRVVDGEESIQASNDLQNEFHDLQNNGLANDFLMAEHEYCRLVNRLQNKLLEGAGIDTGFLNE